MEKTMTKPRASGGRENNILLLTGPIFVELLLQMLVGNADQIMVGWVDPNGVGAIGNANQVTNLLLLVFSIQLGWVPVWSATEQNYVLPVISLCMYPMAYITRLTKTSMLDALNQDYIRTARAKGVASYKVIFKHALRNALIPVVTYVGPMVAFIITGSMVVESIFSTGGLGSYFVSSITNRDYTLIMGVTIFLAILMVTANLITDIVYKLIDPRITFD